MDCSETYNKLGRGFGMDMAKKLAAWFLIPRGPYCYDPRNHHKMCPFFSYNSERPEQESGYCSYLRRGDWDINKDKKWTSGNRQPDGSYTQDETLRSGEEIGIPMSLLWDQVKECRVKE